MQREEARGDRATRETPRLMSSPEPSGDAQQMWEEAYRSSDRRWSGRVNARLAEFAGSLPAGRALDLGCGEGGDACWLAERGWQVLAVDVAPTALARAKAAAEARNVASRIDFQLHDLSDSFPAGLFDLVSAQYLHSFARLDRTAIFRAAVNAVAPDGILLIVDHASAPPWADKTQHEHHFPSADKVVASLGLDETRWRRLRVGSAEREATGPDGRPATVSDNLIVVRRVG